MALLAICVGTGCQLKRAHADLLSPEAVVLDLPLVQQDDLYECGLVSISALCQYYQIRIAADDRQGLVHTARAKRGLSGAELRAVLEKHGMEVFIFPGALDRSPSGLYHHIDHGRPLVVMTEEGRDRFHYSLVLGYDEPLENILLLDPYRGRILLPASVFDRRWAKGERFTLLSVPAPKGTGESAEELEEE